MVEVRRSGHRPFPRRFGRDGYAVEDDVPRPTASIPTSAWRRITMALRRPIHCLSLAATLAVGAGAPAWAGDPLWGFGGRLIGGAAQDELEGIGCSALDVTPGPARPPATRWQASVSTVGAGEFRVTRIPADVRLVELTFDVPEDMYCDVQPIVVGPGMSDLAIHLRPSGTLRGRVDLGAMRKPRAFETLTVRGSWKCGSRADAGTTTARVEHDGTFQLNRVPLEVDAFVRIDRGDALKPGVPSDTVVGRVGAPPLRVRGRDGSSLRCRLTPMEGHPATGLYRVDVFPHVGACASIHLALRSDVVACDQDFEFDHLDAEPLVVEVHRIDRTPLHAQHPRSSIIRSMTLVGRRAVTVPWPAVLSIQAGFSDPVEQTVRVVALPDSELSVCAWHNGQCVSSVRGVLSGPDGSWIGPLTLPTASLAYSIVASDERGHLDIAQVVPGSRPDVMLRPSAPLCLWGDLVSEECEPAIIVACLGGWAAKSSTVRWDGRFTVCGLPTGALDVLGLLRVRPERASGLAHWSQYQARASLRGVAAGSSALRLVVPPR